MAKKKGKEKKIIKVPESEWVESKYRTREWEQSVEIRHWMHDYENGEYVITYVEL